MRVKPGLKTKLALKMTEVRMMDMKRKPLQWAGIWLAVVLLVMAGLSCQGQGTAAWGNGPVELQVLGQNKFLAGSQAAVRLITFNPSNQEPVGLVPVSIKLTPRDGKPVVLYTGRTGRDGSLDASFMVPADLEGGAELAFTAGDGAKAQELTATVTVEKSNKIYLSTDKPLYQPGQVIHIRTLSLGLPALKPVGSADLLLEVEDAKGNKVFKQTLKTDQFGIAAVDFQLADEINMGEFHIKATLGQDSAEKSVTVKRYVLPKFKLRLSSEKSFYLPGDTLQGTLQADYIFGKPIVDGEVVLDLYTFDVAYQKVGQVVGRTDKNGTYTFEIPLPSYFVGQPLEKGKGTLKIEATVTDSAQHKESKSLSLPVVKEPLALELYPEGGTLKPGLENVVYLLASYPDGSAARCTVSVDTPKGSRLLKTDEAGWGSFTITPPEGGSVSLTLTAKDAKGNQVTVNPSLEVGSGAESVLLRTDKSLYRVGDSLQVTVLSTHPRGTVYLDIIKDGQTVLTRSMDMKAGKGQLKLDLTPDLFGMLTLHAYRILPSQDIIRDTRNVYVNPVNDLAIKLTTDQTLYRPGQEGKISFQVTDANGRPILAALGVDIVDEAVFELGERQPGLERVYFLLEKELMEPKYEIHGIQIPDVCRPTDPTQVPEKDRLAQVLFTQLPPQQEYPVQLNSYNQKLVELYQKLQTISSACYSYNSSHQVYPDKIELLVKEDLVKPADILDPWGRAIYLAKPESPGGVPVPTSLGPDGIRSKDDLTQASIQELAPQLGLWRGRDERMFMEDGAVFKAGMGEVGMPMPMAAMPAAANGAVRSQAVGGEGAARPVKVREFFPETMYFNPAVITDASGRAVIPVTFADSITTWRLSAFGNSLTGALGSLTAPIRVFQDFFVDIDLPVALTQGDEASIPVALYNYLKENQKVNLSLEQGDWFSLVDDTYDKQVTLKPDQVAVVYYHLKVKGLGTHKLTVTARGSKLDDAIRREIRVEPDGKMYETTQSDRLEGTVKTRLTLPAEAVPGASKILVTIYPGILSQVMEGLDNIFRMPSGCFEQTSSTTYPNVLVLDYLKKTKKITPEIRMKAEGYINTGYQRLVSFEVPGGGFSWFGDAPANQVLTAFGLLEFRDMSKVSEVDENLINRTQDWLMGQQQKDGSWKPDAAFLHQESWSRIQNNNLPVTAYITWALTESGYKGAGVDKALGYLKAHWQDLKDPYVLALIANALVTTDPQGETTRKVLSALAALAIRDKDGAHWEGKLATATFSEGRGADLETSALATYAFVKSGGNQGLASEGLSFLVKSKDPSGTWYSTQATILCMKALLLAQEKASEAVDATVTITVNGKKTQEFKITSADYDVYRQADFSGVTRDGENTVEISLKGKGSCYYQVVGRYYRPWNLEPKPKDLLSIKVNYDRTQLKQDDTIGSTVTVINNTDAVMQMVMVDIGLPPGFSAQTEDLDGWVKQGLVKKYTLTGRQIMVYLEKLDGKQVLKLSYHLKARFPIKAKTPQSRAYQYYNPDVESLAAPATLIVK